MGSADLPGDLPRFDGDGAAQNAVLGQRPYVLHRRVVPPGIADERGQVVAVDRLDDRLQVVAVERELLVRQKMLASVGQLQQSVRHVPRLQYDARQVELLVGDQVVDVVVGAGVREVRPDVVQLRAVVELAVRYDFDARQPPDVRQQPRPCA